MAGKQRRRARLVAAIDEAKSGGCAICGYKKCLSALAFHHVGGSKVDKVSSLQSISAVRNEIDKCVLLCANCHAEVHAGLIILPESE